MLANSLPSQLLGWALVAVFLAVPVVLIAGRRREHGLAGRLRRLIAKPRLADVAAPPELPTPSEAAGLPAAAAPPATRAAYLPPGERPASPVADGPPLAAPEGAYAPPAAARPPALPGARLARETIAPLADRVDRSRRLAICEARVAQTLSELPRDRWLIERYVLVAGRRVPFLILGETGVFGVWPLDGAHHPDDPALFNDAADVIHNLLPGYPGPVHAGICRAADPGLQPRWWFSPQGKAGGWVMGLKWLIPWLEHFGTDHGFGVKDLERFDQLAGPHWNRRATGARIPNKPHAG